MALDYQRQLEALEPNVRFLMSLYLHSSIDAAVIVEAKKAGIRGVKVYPAGVTTHSSSGVTDLRAFYPVFQEMQNQELVLSNALSISCITEFWFANWFLRSSRRVSFWWKYLGSYECYFGSQLCCLVGFAMNRILHIGSIQLIGRVSLSVQPWRDHADTDMCGRF